MTLIERENSDKLANRILFISFNEKLPNRRQKMTNLLTLFRKEISQRILKSNLNVKNCFDSELLI